MSSTADRRRMLAELAADRDRRGRGGRILRRSLAILGLLLGVTPVVLWACGFFATPPAVADMRRLVDEQVSEYGRIARGEVPFASAPSPGPLFERLRGVPQQHREQAGRELGRLWQARERAEMASYFSLPPDERQAELDRRIRAEEERRRQWEQERERRGRERAAADQRPANDGDPRPAARDQRGPAAGGGPGGPVAARAGGGPRGDTSQEARNQRTKRRIDNTTPEERAQQAEYRRAMEKRREQLGLQPGGGRRGG